MTKEEEVKQRERWVLSFCIKQSSRYSNGDTVYCCRVRKLGTSSHDSCALEERRSRPILLCYECKTKKKHCGLHALTAVTGHSRRSVHGVTPNNRCTSIVHCSAVCEWKRTLGRQICRNRIQYRIHFLVSNFIRKKCGTSYRTSPRFYLIKQTIFLNVIHVYNSLTLTTVTRELLKSRFEFMKFLSGVRCHEGGAVRFSAGET